MSDQYGEDNEPESAIEPVYGIEDTPPLSEALPLALQHVLAMFAGNITAPIIVAGLLSLSFADRSFLIQCALFAGGVGTVMQAGRKFGIGARLPIVMGTSNAFIPTLVGIGGRFGLGAILGAGFIGGLVEIVFGKLLRFVRGLFSPLVVAVVILTIGITLIPVGINQAASGGDTFGVGTGLLLAALVLVSIIVFNQFGSRLLQIGSILFGLLVGYLVAIIAGLVDFSEVAQASWFSIPMPFQYAWTFTPSAVIAMIVMYIVSGVETIGDVSALTVGGEAREPSHEETSGAVVADGIASAFGAIFNAFPNTSYSQNVGVVTLTGVMSRHVVRLGGVLLILFSLVPKLSAFIATIPTPVLGGAAIVMFAMVATSGLVLLRRVPLNRRNLLIVAVSLGLSVGLNVVPEAFDILPGDLQLIFAETGVATATLVAVVLDQVLPRHMRREARGRTST